MYQFLTFHRFDKTKFGADFYAGGRGAVLLADGKVFDGLEQTR